MRFCRFLKPAQSEQSVTGEEAFGRVEDQRVLELDAAGKAVADFTLEEITFLPPVSNCRIFGIGRNYKAHIDELNPGWQQETPLIFMKPDSALCAHNSPIRLPAEIPGRVDYEGELAIVIGRKCRRVAISEGLAVIAGYTIANDISARELQKSDGQWTRAKGYDTFCPVGPWIERDLDPSSLDLCTRLNGSLVQQGNTEQMIRGVQELVSAISSFCTLKAGDLILTGTPAGVGALQPGDRVTVEIEGLGLLANSVEADA